MNKSYNTILIVGLSVCLGGLLSSCAYFDVAADSENVEPVVEQDVGLVESAPDDYAQSVARRTQGRVQVFSLDGSSHVASGQADMQDNIVVSTREGVQQDDSFNNAPVVSQQGMLTSDPSVQVFPLDGLAGKTQMATAVQPFDHVSSPVSSFGQARGDVLGRDGVTVYFGYNSAQLDDEAHESLGQFTSGLLAQGHFSKVSIQGYASPSTLGTAQSRAANLKISMDRAYAVARVLMDQGVPADKIDVRAYGESPAAPVSDMGMGIKMDDMARRVEVRLLP